MEIRPQPGPQEAFLASPADIAIFGGAAGGGKTMALLMEPLRHVTTNKAFAAVCFRRTTTQVRNPGGLWDASMRIYPLVGGRPISNTLEYRWSDGGVVKFAHLETEAAVMNWHGSEVPLLLFDELTTFTSQQFWYLLSRNRSTSGVRPYVRATTNPDADSWVAELIAWWIDQKTGYPIPERSGVIRWFVRVNDVLYWADTAAELMAQFPGQMPKSLTFIAAKLDDNPALTKADPGYRANLMAMSRVNRERLLGGNWKVRPAAGMIFPRHEVTLIDALPTDVRAWCRRWDLAASVPSEDNADPDWTAGVLMGRRESGRIVIADLIHMREIAANVRKGIRNTASLDKARHKNVMTVLPQDPGQAGKDQAQSLVTHLAGFRVKVVRETGDKQVRAEPLSAQWQAGNVDVLRAPWTEALLTEMDGFPAAKHDDIVDAASGAFAELAGSTVLERARALAS